MWHKLVALVAFHHLPLVCGVYTRLMKKELSEILSKELTEMSHLTLVLVVLQCFATAALACGMTTHTEIAHRSEVRSMCGSAC